jgi:hypothetical protein
MSTPGRTAVFVVTTANATVLLKEDFEGTKTLSSYNEKSWIKIPEFTVSTWKNCIGILKSSGTAHSGTRCAQLYGSAGDWVTSEMYFGAVLGVDEIWVSWWERL